jgi:hypothetical protein
MGNDISIVRAAQGALIALAVALSGCASSDEKAEEGRPIPYESSEAAPPSTEAAEGTATGEAIALRENAPLRYVVKKGDTLWTISNKFLKDSWQWPELWYVNPKVQNPHLIYPGDELYLYFVDGAPRLAKAGDESGEAGPGTATEKTPEDVLPPGGLGSMAPTIRESALDRAVLAIPLEAIRPFLRGPRLVDEDTLDDAPYVLDFEQKRLLGGSDSVVYVLELERRDVTQYQIVRRGQEYRDPDDNDVIGYEVIPVAESEVRVFGDPSTVYVTKAQIETRAGDYLLPMEEDPLESRFIPHAPEKAVDGRIIAVFNGVSQIGQYQIVALNRGKQHGIEPGHVLTVLQTGRVATDPHSFIGYKVQLPDVNAGTAMVFKTSDRMSFALIMSATRAIHLQDRVEKPEPSQ